ncbi:major facilitator superfamily domain-containing protein [Xylariaceae sp. FL0016]|nr:major facilitator superfamily domain-containing protein [Xylariaceae sp. FL0016]
MASPCGPVPEIPHGGSSVDMEKSKPQCLEMSPDETGQVKHEDINQAHPEIYEEALAKYPNDESIDRAIEQRVKRKLDRIILPLIGVCYFFYYVDKTTLSYAAIFGLKKDLNIYGERYSWLASSFYLGWLAWAICSNLIMQRLPPGKYLAGNIMMWGILLMIQAAVKNFGSLLALRVLSGAAEAIADPAFMLITSMYYTRAEQPSRISAWYIWNGIGVAGGGLIGYGIGHIKGVLASWRYEFLVVGAFCSFWAIMLWFLLPNSPRTIIGFTHEERLVMIARIRQNQTGIEQDHINWKQIKIAYLDYKTWLFTLLGLVGNIPNGGISNFSTLVIEGLGFDTLHTALLGIPQGALVVIWIGLGYLTNKYMPPNSRTIVGAIYMLPTIAGSLTMLLAPTDAYIGRLIGLYLTGSYQASFVLTLSLITSNTGGQSKKMIVSGMIWFGACVGNIVGPFFYIDSQAPSYHLGIGSILVSNCLELLIFIAFRFIFMYENKKKENKRAALRERGEDRALNETAFTDITDNENPNFVYVY